MKIIHTSDWHLGHQLYGYDRTDEHLHFFDCLEEIIRAEQPDALIVSGDIFDVSSPSAAVARMFKDRLLQLNAAWPEMTVIVTAGNHDSASRIDIDRNLWKAGGIYVIGSVRRENGIYDLSDNIISVPGKGYVAAIPFINRAFIPKADKDMKPEESFFNMVADAAADANEGNLPMVLMAHVTVADCDRKGHRDALIGGVDAVDASAFGDRFDYIALGHIHRPQTLGDGRVVYSGSPVAVSFDEDYPHSVCVAEVERGKMPEIRRLEIQPLRKLVTIPKEGADFKKALRMLSKISDSDSSFIRLNVRQEKDLPFDCMDQAAGRLKGKECRFCTIKYERAVAEAELPKTFSCAAQFAESTPGEVAASYFKSIGLPDEVSEEYIGMIAEIENEIMKED